MLFITGCNNNSAGDAAKAVDKFLQEFKNGEYENMYALTNDGAEYYSGIYVPEEKVNCLLFEFLSENLQYEIKSYETTDSNTAVVTVELTNVKISDLLDDIQTMYMEYCAANEDIIEDIDLNDLLYQITEYKFNSGEYETETKETEFTLTYKSGKWAIESGIIIYDDVTGGYITYYYKNTIFGGMEVK